ncbi:hypothetical protein BDP27DRAFT_1335207 [Rhodocollybia butyracea]|uniref:Uncharacterized protein n=1 Tax=Rhodocollybia butyracea TaxID=206335 RepID=A0A9P5U207_9AGAR|nr:hypothetical protein BDP27DRAFT_1335207 [Rhodocollybia butyracea]
MCPLAVFLVPSHFQPPMSADEEVTLNIQRLCLQSCIRSVRHCARVSIYCSVNTSAGCMAGAKSFSSLHVGRRRGDTEYSTSDVPPIPFVRRNARVFIYIRSDIQCTSDFSSGSTLNFEYTTASALLVLEFISLSHF